MKYPVRRWSAMSGEERSRLLVRSEQDISLVTERVRGIVDEVQREGDAALSRLSRDLDRVDIPPGAFRVPAEAFIEAERSLPAELKEAIRFAVGAVRRFHETQKPREMGFLEVSPGVFAGERATPVDSAGLYVPRGRGSFPSMLYMLAVPATVAQVPRVCVVTPPGGGSVDPACLYAASLCGVHEVYRIGGAQAVAALAYGTESIEPVVKIVGPGSMYVTAAKRLVSGIVDTGIPAGPSESVVLADASADPWKVTLDLLVEAEHGADSCAVLFTDSEEIASRVASHMERLVPGLPEPRRGFVDAVFAGYGGLIVADSPEEAAELVNRFAPEHLLIHTASPFDTLGMIRNAGEILLGSDIPFSGANSAAGPNAVLPTGGFARSYSPVSVRDFIKYSSVIFATGRGFRTLEPRVTAIADYEGFHTHAMAYRIRGESPNETSGSGERRPEQYTP